MVSDRDRLAALLREIDRRMARRLRRHGDKSTYHDAAAWLLEHDVTLAAPAPAGPPNGKPEPIRMEDFAAEVILRVSGLPDRTSPDDQPDMMLVTAEELEDIILGIWDDWPVGRGAPAEGAP